MPAPFRPPTPTGPPAGERRVPEPGFVVPAHLPHYQAPVYFIYALTDPLTFEMVYIAEASSPTMATKTLLEGGKWMGQKPTPEFLTWGASLGAGERPAMVALEIREDYDTYGARRRFVRQMWELGMPLLNKPPRGTPLAYWYERLNASHFAKARGLHFQEPT